MQQPPFPSQPQLRTARLVLRSFVMGDGPAVELLAGDFAVADTTLNIPHPYERGVAEAWIATHPALYESGRQCVFAITLADTGDLIGAIGLGINRRFENAELGYWVGRPYWNRGYGTEAASGVIEFGFTVLGLHRIYATHLTRNPASGRVMHKAGMTHEGCSRQHVVKWNRFEDLERYGILRDEWKVTPER